MRDSDQEQEMLRQLAQWGEKRASIRAMLLTSSRATPLGSVDMFSDYDVILVVTDIEPFFSDRTWLEEFGPVLVLYRDPIRQDGDLPETGYVTQYENGLKIDFGLWPVERLRRVVAAPKLPEEFDAGFRVLLDKDGLTDGLKPPTYKAYIPTPPTDSDYQAAVEEFFLDATYMAKFLWRDDLMAAKHLLDHFMKQERLLPALEWHLETDHQWSVKPGRYGQRLKRWLRPDLWVELESTYTGVGLEANWEALFRTIELFRRVAIEVGERMGYAYPHDLDRRVMAYLQKVKNLDRQADIFS